MNEFDFIQKLRAQMKSRKASPRVLCGIGDDAAVITQSLGRDSLITADLLIEGIDFHRGATSPRLLGHKALAVSLSDIAAMGARPAYSLVSLGLPEDIWDTNFKERFYEGYLALAEKFGVTLIGGDISRADQIVIDSIVLGELRSGAAVLRSTARAGDQLFVTGALGGAAAGLKLIELGARLSEPPDSLSLWESAGVRERSLAGGAVARMSEPPAVAGGPDQSETASIDSLLLRQLRPDARVGWGVVLGDERLATAMIDISDGISSDLNHLCLESAVGAVIEAAAIPVDQNVIRLCGRRALDPLALALHGGEDFELLFTVSPENVSRLPQKVDGVPVARIGEITDAPGHVRIREKNREWDLRPEGFEHFSR